MQQSTGIAGLDEILGGGLTPERTYLIEGGPGSGKTTLALQWLMAGTKAGGNGLYLALAETRDELEEVTKSHGWSLEGVRVCESVVPEETLKPEEQYSVFHPSDVELNETTRQLMEEVERSKPRRVVIDSLSEMRVLAQNPFRHRQQIVALKRYLQPRGCTVMMLDDTASEPLDLHLQTAAHGVIRLEQMPVQYGTERRRLRVVKMRGKEYILGYHDFTIHYGGIEVFPRLVALKQSGDFQPGRLASGIAELDTMLGGGPRFGTSTLVMGSAGTGKSTVSQQFAVAAARRGEGTAIFIFEESLGSLLARSDSMNLGVRQEMEAGRIHIERIDPGLLSPGELAAHIRKAVERTDGVPAKVVVIDSLNAYLNAMPDERFLLVQLHELLTYLNHRGIVTFIVMAHQGLVGHVVSPVETTYLADNVILMRFFEAAGESKLAIAAVKMRSTDHERTIREMRLGPGGIRIGPPLRQFQGVLTGEPTFMDGMTGLLKEEGDEQDAAT